MSGKSISGYVTVGDTTYPPGEVPASVAKLITNPKAWGEAPASEPEPEPTPAADPVPDPAPVPDPTPEKPAEPPRAGKGSSLDAWQDYVKALGLDVPADASRDDLIELVDQHNSTN